MFYNTEYESNVKIDKFKMVELVEVKIKSYLNSCGKNYKYLKNSSFLLHSYLKFIKKKINIQCLSK